jgi:hypothetical protein
MEKSVIRRWSLVVRRWQEQIPHAVSLLRLQISLTAAIPFCSASMADLIA